MPSPYDKVAKCADALQTFIEDTYSIPLAPNSLATYMASLPEEVQARVFEFSLAFLQTLASRETNDVYDAELAHYRLIARDMIPPSHR